MNNKTEEQLDEEYETKVGRDIQNSLTKEEQEIINSGNFKWIPDPKRPGRTTVVSR